MLWLINEGLFVVLALCAALLVIEFGFRLGRRQHASASEGLRSHLGTLQGAVLGLLALLLGFTFSMAVTRFEARKALVVEEANAIGTAALRSEFLPPDIHTSARQLLAGYAQARLDYFAAGVDAERVATALNTAQSLQDQLWSIAVANAVADPHSVPAAQFSASLNELFDLDERRRAALDNHVPELVIWLLMGVTFVALAMIAYGLAIVDRRRHGSTYLFALMIVLVLATILDLDRPRRGLVQVGQGSMERVLQSLN